ncbi:hypothetical protein QAO71_17400 (plasmid) [Halopseudomonas sp. SMJS2]|uniref:hypothetical protein n=1 Tax=Halopseudomonas sp. SMJS2 TaxID=3041098 RepID=UPI0024533486|nr:hypothetical protein [Halopseudomonas sp. SMJS2]WGK63545.1 hypothetical protein QAO71_17400 [Halopseudomonas sp. SMJS2]
MNKMTTKVFALPADAENRMAFLNGVKALAEKHGVDEIGGSLFDELSYVEMIEKELAEHISSDGVEDLRQEYEKAKK